MRLRFLALTLGVVLALAAPVTGLGVKSLPVPSSPEAAVLAVESRWVTWYEAATGQPSPPQLVGLASLLDLYLPPFPEGNEDEAPEVHVGWMRNYCNTILHEDCVYNDPTGNSYACDGGLDLHPGFILWGSEPSIVLMNHTIYGTYTEDWVDDTVDEEAGIDSPLTAGGEARHAILVGTNCRFTEGNNIYVQTSGIGFFFPT